MFKQITKFIIVFFTICFLNNFNASHIIGGEVYYDSLGNDQYKVTFRIYRDCWGVTANYDDPLGYTVFNANGAVYSTYMVALTVRDTIALVSYNPCITVPNDVCVESGIYIDTITLPFNPDGYHITYQRCCWSSTVDNIASPSSNGATITTFVTGSSLANSYNNSARFSSLPPILLCANVPLTFDYSATDPDGDSLVYQLIDPLESELEIQIHNLNFLLRIILQHGQMAPFLPQPLLEQVLALVLIALLEK